MDPITVAFYAIICGLLSAFAPPGWAKLARFAMGAVVGIVAASTLPFLQGLMGTY